MKKIYIEVIEDLKDSLNNIKKDSKEVFINCIKELKENFNILISTKFLKNLIKDKENRQKTKRINYLLKECKINTNKISRFFKEWFCYKYKVDIFNFNKNKEGLIIPIYLKTYLCNNLYKRGNKETLFFLDV
jgi:hypothetical protein